MRIAAGVLLIIASLFNGCLGAGATFIGSAATVAVDNVKKTSGAQSAASKKVTDAASEVGSMALLIGVAFLILFGLQLAAAICLFTSKAAKFVMVVGGLGIAIGLWGLAGGGFNLIFVLVSVAISILAIVAAKGVLDEQSGGASAPA